MKNIFLTWLNTKKNRPAEVECNVGDATKALAVD